MKCIACSVPDFVTCVFNLGYALASWLGSKYILSGESTLSDVGTMILVVMLGAYSLGKAAMHVRAFANAVAAASKIYATIDRIPPFSADIKLDKRLEI